MTGTRPTAIGYVSGPDSAALDRQRDLVTRHAQVEGLALERIMTDRFDGFTISQLVADVLATDARFVLIPDGVRMADAQARVALDLEAYGAACVVIGEAQEPAEQPA